MSNGEPERLLLAAVFSRAVRDYVDGCAGGSPEDQREAESAREWLFEEQADDESCITSFRNICLVLDLDRGRARQRIAKLAAKSTAKKVAAAAKVVTSEAPIAVPPLGDEAPSSTATPTGAAPPARADKAS